MAPAGMADGSSPACDPSAIGDDLGPVESIYAVVDGELAGRCFGAPSDALVEAWGALAAVTPPEERELLATFAGYAGGGDTIAYTEPIDDGYDRFLIAIDLIAAEEDPGELRLTTLHEFSHVFTQAPDQLDVDADPETCDVYWSGAGCFLDSSYIARWIDEFWTEADLLDQPEDGSADEAVGEERCALDAGFLGAYAASSPEEDFAEAFSAFVFDLDVPGAVQPRLDWFAGVPELAAFRDRQRASGLPDVPNQFDRCG